MAGFDSKDAFTSKDLPNRNWKVVHGVLVNEPEI